MKLFTHTAAFLLAALAAAPAAAQSVRIGNDGETISRALTNFGFAPQFRVLDRDVLRTEVAACRGEEMYRVRVNLLGAVSTRDRLGRCDIPGAVKEASTQRPLTLDKEQVTAKLRAQGYSRIRWVDDELPRYVAVACTQENRRIRLVMNRRGEVRRRSIDGRCPAQRANVSTDDVRRILRGEGFDRIRLETDRAPFGVVACLNDRRRRLIVNRRGQVVSNERAGRCRNRVNVESVTASLRGAGLRRIEVKKQGDRYFADVCEGSARLQLILDPRGEEERRYRTGTCDSRKASEILSRLESRGARNMELFVEGCFRGDRYRWAFDALGERTKRQRIGRC